MTILTFSMYIQLCFTQTIGFIFSPIPALRPTWLFVVHGNLGLYVSQEYQDRIKLIVSQN
jgi:hypothetical protein